MSEEDTKFRTKTIDNKKFKPFVFSFEYKEALKELVIECVYDTMVNGERYFEVPSTPGFSKDQEELKNNCKKYRLETKQGLANTWLKTQIESSIHKVAKQVLEHPDTIKRIIAKINEFQIK